MKSSKYHLVAASTLIVAIFLCLTSLIVAKTTRETIELAENYLFTREAFAAYLDHLDEGGRLALVVHNHVLMLRVVATLEALSEEVLSCRGKLASSRRAFTPAMVYLSRSNE